MTKAKIKTKPSTTVQNCSFVGVQFDAKAVDAIRTIAEGLVENAKALGALAGVLKASNVNLECMVKIIEGAPHD
jgi:hypothetical protein